MVSLVGSRPWSGQGTAGYWYILPAIAMMTMVHFIPAACSVLVSLLSLDVWYIARWWEAPFVGLKNYATVFAPGSLIGAEFWFAFRQTLRFAALGVAGTYLAGLATALVLNRRFPGRGLVRTIVLLPWIAPVTTVLMTWRLMLLSDVGVVNHFLVDVLGVVRERPIWLIGDNSLWAITAFYVWRSWPFAAVMLLSAMQGIPQELYEAADIDGARPFHKFWYVTMPLLRPVTVILLLLVTLWSLANFNVPYMLLGSAPSPPGRVLMLFIYNYAFANWDFSLGAAMSAVLMVFMLAVSLIYRRYLTQEV